MSQNVVLMLIIILGSIIFFVVEGFRAKKKRLAQIHKNFGAVPNATYRRSAVPDYWKECHAQAPSFRDVDEITWNDLDMEEVYDRINACQTTVGQDYLYAMLHQPLAEEAQLLQREKLMQALEEDGFRIKVQLLLAKLGKCIGTNLPALLFHTDLFTLEAPWRFTLSAISPLLGIPLLLFDSQLAIGWMVLSIGHNVWLYLNTQKRLESRLETISYLMAMFRCGEKLRAETATRCPDYAALLQKALLPTRKMGISTAALSPAPQSDADTMMQIISMVTLLPIIQYCKSVKVLKESNAALRLLYQLIGEIDSAVSILSYRKSVSLFTKPVFIPTLQVNGTGIVHPLLDGAVANDATVQENWLLTGSNASGKSTFIKAIAINQILAQTIHTCTAQQYELMLAPVVTSMAVQDSVVDGESYFIAEIKSMQRIVRMVDQGVACYCFIDEILKGTNTVERIAASFAVLKHLACPNCLCVTATHDIELTELLAERYCNFHFSEQISSAGIEFDYKLKQGPSTTRNAIRLLEYYQFPAQIVADANAQATNGENAALHANVQTKKACMPRG